MTRTLTILVATLIVLTQGQATVWDVSVVNFGFSPDTLTILQGDTVVWTNTDGFHNVRHTCEPSRFGNEPAEAVWAYEFVFDVPVGAYPYICEIHPEMMRGLVKVRPRGRWDVIVRNFEFVPQDITVTQGDTVVWTNIEGFHNVHHDDEPSLFGNAPDVDPWEYAFVFDLPEGTYPYLCEVHGMMMAGSVTVASPAALDPPAGLTVFSNGAAIFLAWSSVCGTTAYRVYRGTDVSANVFPVMIAETVDTTVSDTLGTGSDARFFYQVTASND